jgi:membrane protein required for colicin V production
VLLGAIHLVIVAALPGERTPRWLSEAALRPLSAGAARAIQIILPGIGRGADAISPVVDSSVRRGFSDDDALPRAQSGPTSPPNTPE